MTWLTWLQGTCAYQPFKANLPFVWSHSRLLFQKIFFFEKISYEGFFNCYSGQEYFLVLLRVSKSGFLGDWSKKWDHPSRWLWLGLMSRQMILLLFCNKNSLTALLVAWLLACWGYQEEQNKLEIEVVVVVAAWWIGVGYAPLDPIFSLPLLVVYEASKREAGAKVKAFFNLQHDLPSKNESDFAWNA